MYMYTYMEPVLPDTALCTAQLYARTGLTVLRSLTGLMGLAITEHATSRASQASQSLTVQESEKQNTQLSPTRKAICIGSALLRKFGVHGSKQTGSFVAAIYCQGTAWVRSASSLHVHTYA